MKRQYDDRISIYIRDFRSYTAGLGHTLWFRRSQFCGKIEQNHIQIEKMVMLHRFNAKFIFCSSFNSVGKPKRIVQNVD